LVSAALVLGAAIVSGCAANLYEQTQEPDVTFVKVNEDITLRRMVVHNSRPRGTVLFLHGFPETLYAWKEISLSLASDYEVHAFDWPGYGRSSRPSVARFAYAPRDYSQVLKAYIEKASIDTSTLTIYATDIGALPALLLALEEPGIAKTIIVGDFAPFNRPHYMYESLQNLKSKASAEQTRVQMNANREEILTNAFNRGLPKEAQFTLSRELQGDMSSGWSRGMMTSADAFYHYYSHFTRDQEYLEANLGRLKTQVRVVWGENDIYINKEMGVEFATRISAELTIIPGVGHYPHLQTPELTIEEIHAAFR